MKKPLILLLTLSLFSCDEWKRTAQDRDAFVASMKVGDEWKSHETSFTLKEADEEYAKYFIEGIRGFYYITVKDKHIVSIWVKPKPY